MKTHKFSYDMYLIEYNGLGETKFNTMPTTPLGTDCIESTNKEITTDEIYEHLKKTVFAEFDSKMVSHPFDLKHKTSIKVLRLDKYNHVIINNIRKIR